MGFVDSYMLIMILGFFSHKFYQKIRPKNKTFIAWYSILIVAFFMIFDILIYIGLFDNILSRIPWSNIQNGKDFMWNPFMILGLDFNITYNSLGFDWIATLLFLSYAPWYLWAKNLSQFVFGNRSYSGGWWWIVSPITKPKIKKN